MLWIMSISMSLFLHYNAFFLFKQKTAYELRISDWSSDVCSSDLFQAIAGYDADGDGEPGDLLDADGLIDPAKIDAQGHRGGRDQIGRASCRERVCQYV